MTSSFGSFMNHNHFAGYAELGAMLSLGLCLDRVRREGEVSGRALLWAGAAGLTGLAHLASQSRGGLLGLGAGLATFALLRWAGPLSLRRAALAVAAAAAILAASFAVLPASARERVLAAATDGSASYRLHLSAATLRLAAAHPLLGAGLGAFEDAVTAFRRGDGDVRATHAENDVLEFTAETGLLGLAALAFGIWRLGATGGRSPRSSALGAGAVAAAVALGVHSLCDFNLRVPATALALAVCLAVASPARPGSVSPGWLRAAIPAVLAALGLAAATASVASVLEVRARPLADPVARVAALTRALSWNPLATETRRDRARALVQAATGGLREARLARAAEDYRRVLEGRPRWAEAWYELAWVELARGDRVAARRAVEKAGELDPVSVPLARAREALMLRLRQPS